LEVRVDGHRQNGEVYWIQSEKGKKIKRPQSDGANHTLAPQANGKIPRQETSVNSERKNPPFKMREAAPAAIAKEERELNKQNHWAC